MIDFVSKRWINLTRIINLAVFLCIIVVSFLVDGNGRILVLSEKASSIIGILFFSVGIIFSNILAIIDKRYRLVAVLFLIIYFILIALLILPL